ncbi:SH3 domain-containing protein [Syncephalis fuscata]|nr:SH3 domain-containing protein [Syncephalis fuscata]
MTSSQMHVVRALYYFPGDQPGDLLFEEGDVIDVYEMDNENWWEGKSRRTGEYGAFPSTLVEVINIGVAPPPIMVTVTVMDSLLTPKSNTITITSHGVNMHSTQQHSHTTGPPSLDDNPRFEANIQDDLLQLMQEAAMEAEGLIDRPLPPPPSSQLAASISSKTSRSDRPLPNCQMLQ